MFVVEDPVEIGVVRERSAPLTSSPAAPAGGGRLAPFARAATEMLAPAALVAALLMLLGWYSDGRGGKGLLLGAVAGVFESLIPFGYILWQVRAGRITDHHIRLREQRMGPLLFALASAAVGLVVMLGFDAPTALVAGVVAGGAGLLVSLVVSRWWKMSIHAAVAAGACAIVFEMFGPIGLVCAPAVAVVGWSRVALRDHTVPQVIVGAIVGALVAGTVFGAFR